MAFASAKPSSERVHCSVPSQNELTMSERPSLYDTIFSYASINPPTHFTPIVCVCVSLHIWVYLCVFAVCSIVYPFIIQFGGSGIKEARADWQTWKCSELDQICRYARSEKLELFI